MRHYTKSFYKIRRDGVLRSAKEIIPLLVRLIKPTSVIDVGCGDGIWLSAFREYGVEDIFGIDGDWVNEQILQIPEERFLVLDLKEHFRIDRQFDLVLSLEVAEHLPPQCAQILVDSLTRLGPVIVFSAAIPYQGGTNHLNEQWPTYWARFFEDKKYIPVDCIRKRIWQNNKVGLWYAQNLIIFVREDDLATYPLLKKEFKNMSALQLDVVHPIHYSKLIKRMSNPRNLPLLKVLLALPDILRKAVKRFFPK